ncbi:MAG: replication-associated recombination protein A [Deltaproteobacteria bacterium]|nr:replication-associated recombination protein A [Deltaproteobacteria bacterium]
MSETRPLPERLRPLTLSDVVGHPQICAQLQRALAQGELRSTVFWGPPGSGKTTLAKAIAHDAGRPFVQLSAVMDGVKQLREVVAAHPAGLLLFVDEIHRWNKAQQDALLPWVEDGRLVLVGATTENPSFELTRALRSRLRLLRLEPLSDGDILTLLHRALEAEHGLPYLRDRVDEEALVLLAQHAAGDARRALDTLERCLPELPPDERLDAPRLAALLPTLVLDHDRGGDAHYDVLSALIKSMRGSHPDAALYWLARLLEGGEPPRAIARRLVIFAAEDVGNADPRALQVAVASAQAVELTGMPEARIPLGQAVTWLASSPKSNAAYLGINRAIEEVRRSGALPVPAHLRSAEHTGYKYPHDYPHRVVEQAYLPDALPSTAFYRPEGQAEEKRILERLAWWAARLRERR